MRLFVGIPMAAAVIDELSTISLQLRSKEDGLRWQTPESWHITLQFLGNTSREQYECAAAQLRTLNMPPVPIRLEGLSAFNRAGILIAAVTLTPELLLLQERVTTATAHCGFVAETRPYQPHITLPRGKGKGQQPGLLALKIKLRHQPVFTRFSAREFLLYESFLGPAGSHYEVRERFSLGAG
jgi:2'-5' RNA ligase